MSNTSTPSGTATSSGKSVSNEDRVEVIRNLKKNNEDNKICFNCGDRGPQSVCLPFNTFVCTLCHSIHTQYSHRCKGLSH